MWPASASRSTGASEMRAAPTDERLQAGSALWAVGDVTGHGAFTHVAMYQADIPVRDILGQVDRRRPTTRPAGDVP